MKERKDDSIWKVVMEEVFDDLMRFVYPDADQVYDLGRRFEFLEQELAQLDPDPEEPSDTRYADKLVKVFTKEGREEWVLVHLEIQGDTWPKEAFAERMLHYFYRIFTKHRKPVSAVAIFTGQYGQGMPNRFHYEFHKTRLLYEYHTLSVLDYQDGELIENNNPFALVVLGAKTSLLEEQIPEKDLLRRKLLIAKELFKRGYSNKKVRAIYRFLENVILFEDPENNLIFSKETKSLDKNNVMGIDEYVKQEGIKETQEKFVKSLLSNTDFSEVKIAELAGVSMSIVEKVKKETGIRS